MCDNGGVTEFTSTDYIVHVRFTLGPHILDQDDFSSGNGKGFSLAYVAVPKMSTFVISTYFSCLKCRLTLRGYT